MADDELEPLITECPSCHTRFRVAEPQLDRAGGRVRCGACLTVFHGVEHLILESAEAYADEDQARRALDDVLDELAGSPAGSPAETALGGSAAAPVEAPAAIRDRLRSPPRGPIFAGFEEPDDASPLEPEPSPPAAASGKAQAGEADVASTFLVLNDQAEAPRPPAGSAGPEKAPQPTDAAASGAMPASPTPAAAAAADGSGAAPAADPAAASGNAAAAPGGIVIFGERPARRPWVWAGIAAGILLLVIQVLWYQFDDWAKDPQWRAVYGPLCGVLGCELPQQRDRSLLAARNLAVRTHPSEPTTLLVNAMIVNQAEFPQPFPVLELSFTTVRGNLVAGRRFEPEDYLAGDAAGMEMIPPRTPVQVELTMADPGPEAVNYFLRFR